MTTATTIEDMILQTDAAGAPVRLKYVRGHMKVGGLACEPPSDDRQSDFTIHQADTWAWRRLRML